MVAKRVLISIDERLLQRVDEACARRGMTRSGYLAQLASADLEPGNAAGGDARARAALSSIDDLLAEPPKG